MTLEEQLYRAAQDHGGGDSLIAKILPLIEQDRVEQRKKGVRDGYSYALSDVDLATDLSDAYRRVSDGHKKAVEHCYD